MHIRSLLFLGSDDASSRQAHHRLAHIVPTIEAHFGTWQDAKKFPARTWAGDMILSYRSRWIVPASVLSRAKQCSLNLHPGTPEYPGIGATNFALYDNAPTFGATLHHMAPVVDSGPIVAVERFPVRVDESLSSLTRRTHAAVDRLLIQLLLWLSTAAPLPHSSETWSGTARRRKDLDALTEVSPKMSSGELKQRWRATYMPGLPDRFVAQVPEGVR